ncbi:hypothetical protein, partial [Sphingomonas sp. 37zxx]|uniref:hypothetical protein n=1 Tax=Sphingomonas sp. 37zxx TaxID=1550073 RepID=UPI0018CD91E7
SQALFQQPVKTVYEAADIDQAIPANLQLAGGVLGDDALKRVLLYRAFIRTVFVDIKKELKQQLLSSLFKRALDRLGIKKSDISGSIDELLEGSFEAQITDITAIKTISKKISDEAQTSQTNTNGRSFGGNISPQDTLIAGRLDTSQQRAKSSTAMKSEDYADVVLRTFAVSRVIEDLGKLLSSVGINKLYIFIDDFSELPEEAMKVFVDTVLAPLNN